MHENLFKYTNINEKNVNFLNGMAKSIEEETKRYEKLILEKGIDI